MIEYFAELWQAFLAYLNTQPPAWICFFLFLGAFSENVAPPVPGDTLIVFGAYLAGIGVVDVWPAYLSMWAGSAVGCMLVYGVAYLKGRDFFLALEARYFRDSKIAIAESWFERYGSRIVIFNRFLPTVRAFVGIVAGITRMNPVRMTIYVVIGTFLWNSLLVYFGLKVGENWQLVIQALHTYNQFVLGVGVVVVVGWYVVKWRARRRLRSGRGAEGQGAEGGSGVVEQASRRAGEQEKDRDPGRHSGDRDRTIGEA